MKQLFLLFYIIALPVFSFAQEDTAILCADGIDNDGDGWMDCEDSSCQKLLYQSNDFEFNDNSGWWNGEFRGKKMSNGTYVYHVEVLYQNGISKAFKGDIILLN